MSEQCPEKTYLEDHFSPGHAFHNNLSVTGRGLPYHLGANGWEVEQDHLQGVGVQQKLQTKQSAIDTPWNPVPSMATLSRPVLHTVHMILSHYGKLGK